MSVNQNDEVSLSDRYVLLLQEPIYESRALRAQVAAREEETDSKIERLSNTVEELCEQVSRTDSESSCSRRKRRSASSVAVPSQCKVSLLYSFLYMHYEFCRLQVYLIKNNRNSCKSSWLKLMLAKVYDSTNYSVIVKLCYHPRERGARYQLHQGHCRGTLSERCKDSLSIVSREISKNDYENQEKQFWSNIRPSGESC